MPGRESRMIELMFVPFRRRLEIAVKGWPSVTSACDFMLRLTRPKRCFVMKGDYRTFPTRSPAGARDLGFSWRSAKRSEAE